MKYFYDLYSPISLVYFFFHTTGLFLYAVFFRVKRRVEQIICIDRGTGVMQLYFSLEAFVIVAGALCTFADPLQFPVLVWILSVNPSRSLSTSATLEASPAFWPTLARTAHPPEPSCHPGVFPSPAGRGLFQHLPSLFLGFLSHLIRRISPFLTSPHLVCWIPYFWFTPVFECITFQNLRKGTWVWIFCYLLYLKKPLFYPNSKWIACLDTEV